MIEEEAQHLKQQKYFIIVTLSKQLEQISWSLVNNVAMFYVPTSGSAFMDIFVSQQEKNQGDEEEEKEDTEENDDVHTFITVYVENCIMVDEAFFYIKGLRGAGRIINVHFQAISEY